MTTKKQRQNTETSSFGVSGRYGHDSSKFYESKLYSNVSTKKNNNPIENFIDERKLNHVYCKDSRKMNGLPDNSVHLMVTSPPYNATKEYDDDLTLEEYLKLLKDVFTETYRVLVHGGRACINIANLGRKPYVPLTAYINKIMLDIGFFMRGEIIWNKAASSGGSCAWGSWQSASNPVLRDVHEYILIFCKEDFQRKPKKENTIGRDEFLEYTKSIWTFNTESAKKVKHPAPFPVELPYRLIQLYTYKGDIVIDPFNGSGTTCIAAIKTERYYVGYDIDKEYCKIAKQRIKTFVEQSEVKFVPGKALKKAIK